MWLKNWLVLLFLLYCFGTSWLSYSKDSVVELYWRDVHNTCRAYYVDYWLPWNGGVIAIKDQRIIYLKSDNIVVKKK
jgi:hypothetical protein